MSKVSIQQLLRPTDTCKFMIHGKLLGLDSNQERILALVKHETTKIHALFVFEVDNLGSLSVDMLMPVYGMFTATIQSTTPAGCRVEINIHGETIVFLLPYDTSTALFFSNINLAKESYNSYSSDETNKGNAFDWLRGYENCRTGWDRFCKPDGGQAQEEEEIQSGFPDNWPWSYIITPHPDGKTDVAVCESLINEFDPLRQGSGNAMPLSVNVVGPSPQSSPRPPLPKVNPFTYPAAVINSVRPSSSETNISRLRLEQELSPPLPAAHSQNNLTSHTNRTYQVSDGCVRPAPRKSPSPKFPRERPQGKILDASESFEMDNPFTDYTTPLEEKSRSKFWLESDEREVEMTKVTEEEEEGEEEGEGEGRRDSSTMQRPFSLEGIDSLENLDYKNRRMRSQTSTSSREAILTQSATVVPSSVPSAPAEIHGKTKSTSVLPSQARSKSPRLFRKKVKTDISVSPEPKTNWVTRYQPGVLLLKGTMRECLIQRMLQEREANFCERKSLRLFCGTWNVNGQHAMQRVDKWLNANEELPDIYAIGFQELDLSPDALLRNESNREEMWIDLVEMSLKLAGKYKQICVIRLVGILLLVYAKQELVPYISEVDSDFVPCGIMGHLGNKGGVAIRFNVYHSSICIVNSHLAAHTDEVEKRNQDYHQIYSKLQFFKSSSLPYAITDHNVVVWMGDLNYRIQMSHEMTGEIIKALADKYQFSKLLRHDQLLQQQKKGEAFTRFKEATINFKPTYKYDPSTNSWDTSEKNRAPAWCDRVLYYCEDESTVNVICYQSHPEMIISDHKPVSAVFDIKAKVVIPEKERDVLEHITWQLDKQENDTLPQVELEAVEFIFEEVKFMVEKTKYLKLRNVGQRAVQLSFLTTPDKDSICKPWLTIKPEKALILPEEEVSITLTVLIDSEMASRFINETEKLEDIIVLHLDGGKDFFISITGNFLQTCFGSSLETLVHVHSYIRDVPTAQLLDIALSSSWAEYDEHAKSIPSSPLPPLDIPKELYQLVNHLSLHGLDTENLFTDGGLTVETERIRDAVDTGIKDLPGSVYSVAATLLTFLRALSEPVVPRGLHQRCSDACNNPTLCRQVLMLMPKVHKRVFVYLITFLKQLLDHSQENQMDAKVLASIFGDILLNTSREMRLSHTKKVLLQYSKKKATFIYQFLVNDLTVDYR